MAAHVPSEVSWGWIYLPPFLIDLILGFILAMLLTRYLNRSGLSRYFWYPPLAFLALVTLCTSLVGLFFLAP